MGPESNCKANPGDRSATAKPLVLVVADEPFMRRFFRTALEEAGCLVEEACSGEEAIALLQQQRPDLVVLDLVMPGMDDFQTCAALRGLEEGKHTPILVVTSLQDTAAIHQAIEAGATDFITKPVNGELLGCRARYLLRAGSALEDLARSEANLQVLRAAVESLPIGITIRDAQGRIIYTNPAEAVMHGYEAIELLHQDVRVLAPKHLHCSTKLDKLERYAAWQRESINRRKDGAEFPVQLSSVAVRNAQGDFLGIITACEDISERKKSEAQIHQLAFFDTLTGLSNRALFMDYLQKALAQADRSDSTVGLLFLDLDHFKDINDTQGHEFGDKLLQEVARRLSHCLRAADYLARLGGDEFVVMIGAGGQEAASATALRIMETFRPPFDIEGRRIYASFSIGIALYPDDAPDLEGLLRSADTAMYQAKARGRQNFQFFSAKMSREIVEKVSLESALRLALERNDLYLVYQPQWDLLTGRHCGVEVLIRWCHPELGEISPMRVIQLAESSGQIFQLGEWVLRCACAQASAWAAAGFSVGRVAVNISGHQLRQPDFPALIESILAETKLDPASLELEITESVLLEYAGQTVAVLQALKKMGVQLTIDDFGTGYSSLSYLKHFPVDRLKIDRAFIAGMDHEPCDAAIVAAVIALARTLKIKVLAEGVETSAQLAFLQSQGCMEAQGFLLGVPMLAADLVRQLGRVTEPFGLNQKEQTFIGASGGSA
jgi:diguanylate cyclase (GGDEF)-like protein/PAS domain S-box-containing protein